MSFDDFCLCTPSEFRSIYESWRKREESMARQAWERTRTEVTAIFQIVSEQKLDKHELMPFEWDRKDNKDTQPAKKTAPSTRERVEELKERLKNKKKTCHPTL